MAWSRRKSADGPAAGRSPSPGARSGPSRLRIRRARPADAPALAAVRRAAVLDVPPGAFRRADLAAWASLPPLYDLWAMTAGGEAILAAERAGRVVGFAGLRAAELTALFVAPRAARRGVGAALIAAVERLARRRGLRRLSVVAAASAVPFYLARGFAGRRRARVPLPGGRSLAAVRLAKRLPVPGRRPAVPPSRA